MLDRELKDHYYLVIVVKDSAAMPRQVTRVLHIVITDVDDNVPILRRHAVSTTSRVLYIHFFLKCILH